MIDTLKQIFSEFRSLDDLTITEDTVLSADIGLSSLDYFAFITRLEDEFAVRIKDKELLGFRTVGDIIKCINSKR